MENVICDCELNAISEEKAERYAYRSISQTSVERERYPIFSNEERILVPVALPVPDSTVVLRYIMITKEDLAPMIRSVVADLVNSTDSSTKLNVYKEDQ